MSLVCMSEWSISAKRKNPVWTIFKLNLISVLLILNVVILQTQGSHLPLWLLWGCVVAGSHPAHLQVQLHWVIWLQLQHRPGGAVRPSVWLPSIPLTRCSPNCIWAQRVTDWTTETFALDQLLFSKPYHFISVLFIILVKLCFLEM